MIENLNKDEYFKYLNQNIKAYTAHMWYNIASGNGHKSAGDWRDGRASFMSASDIKKATDMANKCMESDYKKCGY